MNGFIPPKPVGSGRDAMFMRAVWDRLFGPEGQLCNTPTVKVAKTSSGIFLRAVNITSGGGITDCNGHAMSCQEITFCDSGGNVKKMMVIGSEPYDP